MITNATPKHEKDCINLIKLALDGLIDKLNLNDEVLKRLYRAKADKSRLSMEHIKVFLDETEEVLGAMGCYDGQIQEAIDIASKIKFEKECFCDGLYVDFIAVKEKSRGKKIGTKLLNHAIKIAKDKNFKNISLIAKSDKDKNIKFYKNLGFKIDKDICVYNYEFKHMVLNINLKK